MLINEKEQESHKQKEKERMAKEMQGAEREEMSSRIDFRCRKLQQK